MQLPYFQKINDFAARIGQSRLVMLFWGLWILGGATAFFLRFSFLFYYAHRSAIQQLWTALFS